MHSENTDRYVLVVDDDAISRDLVERYLVSAGYQVACASSGAEALGLITRLTPRIVICDWVMPGMDGLDLCRTVRSMEALPFIYFLMLTAHTEKAALVEAYKAGVDDYVSKPVDRDELLARMKAAVRISDAAVDMLRDNIQAHRVNAALAIANDRLYAAATVDSLTGVLTRSAGMDRLTEHWSIADRSKLPLSCALIDTDGFKQINDAFGHMVGDRVLQAIAKTLRTYVRAGDSVSRIGGDEFLVLFPNQSAAGAAESAERCRRAVEAIELTAGGGVARTTVSIGVAERTAGTLTPEQLIQSADSALYAAKRAGRNAVRTAAAAAMAAAAPGGVA